MKPSRPVTPQVATLYAELHDLSALDAVQGRNPGSFSVKTIKGRRYWYTQRWIGQNIRLQKSIGPETPELLEKIARWKNEHAAWRQQRTIRQELCRAVKAALRMTIDADSGRVIAALAENNIFEKGGVLIGTHAYISYAAMLGRRLRQANMQTADLDFAVIDVATDATRLFPSAVESVDKAFFQVPPRPGAYISTKLQYRGGQARVELLTPHRRGEVWTPVAAPQCDFGAQQVPYLEYLIESPVEATYLYGDGVRVRVPHPARFALHKMIVAANRGIEERAKRAKDLAQSAELVAILSEDHPRDLIDAFDSLVRYGSEYLEKARDGAGLLDASIKTLLPPALLKSGS